MVENTKVTAPVTPVGPATHTDTLRAVSALEALNVDALLGKAVHAQAQAILAELALATNPAAKAAYEQLEELSNHAHQVEHLAATKPNEKRLPSGFTPIDTSMFPQDVMAVLKHGRDGLPGGSKAPVIAPKDVISEITPEATYDLVTQRRLRGDSGYPDHDLNDEARTNMQKLFG